MSPATLIAKTNKIFSSRAAFFILFIACCYIVLAAFLLNIRLVLTTLDGTFPLRYKLSLLSDLATGIFTAIGPLDSTLLVINGLLIGVNFLLIIKTLRTLEGMGKVKLSIGGTALISLVSAGCGACGFTILSLLGVSASLSFLPFHGLEIHILSLIILLFSGWYMTKKLTAAKICSLY